MGLFHQQEYFSVPALSGKQISGNLCWHEHPLLFCLLYKNGSYSDGNGVYKGDKTIADVRANRDSRLSVFLKEPGQKNILVDGTSPLSTFYRTEPYPGITDGANQTRATTGYLLRKGGAFDVKHYQDVWAGFVGVVLYRSAEALLNYMEASYEKNGTLDGTAREYWQILRRRAHVSEDIDATIMATDMAKEAFGHVNESFDGVRIDNEERLKQIVDLKKQNPELKVLLSVGGWQVCFSDVANDEYRRAFAKDCDRVVKEFDLDGIDIDWEYPTSSMANISASPDDTENFTLLMKDIRAAIGDQKELTLATVASAKYIDFKAILPFINFVNIMAYDMASAPKHHSALYRSASLVMASRMVDK